MSLLRRALCMAVPLLLLAARAGAQADSTAPDPLRFEAEVSAFEALDREWGTSTGQIVCLGSSTIASWSATIGSDLAPLSVVPRGFGGSTMLDALYYVDRLVLAYRPRAVLLYEGDNDVLLGMSPVEVRAAFDAFVGAIRERLPSTRIYVISIKPSPSRWDLWPDMAEANRLLRDACREGSGLRYIDVASAMLGRDGLPNDDLFLDDCLHMNEAGYALWAAIIRPVLLAE